MPNIEIPSVYVNRNLLVNSVHYTYRDKKTLDNEEARLVEFLICEDETDEQDNMMIKSLNIQRLSNGYIINNNVYLNEAQFNCIISNRLLMQCVLCKNDVFNLSEHIKEVNHIDKLQQYLPLMKYNISVIRKINDEYHCGVCSSILRKDDIENHFKSKRHEEKLLLSINTASDLLNKVTSTEASETFSIELKTVNDDNQNDNTSDDYSTDEDGDFCSTHEGSDPEDDIDVKFGVNNFKRLNVQSVPNGYIVDNVIFLTQAHYNCIVDNGFNMNCSICNKVVLNIDEHCKEKAHLDKLLQPSADYDMSVVRVINLEYHCGVCNQLYKKDKLENHFESKEHVQNLLYSMNKASDILDNATATTENTKSCYKFKNDSDVSRMERMNEDRNCEAEINCNVKGSYASKAKIPKTDFIHVKVGNTNFKVSFDSYNMIWLLKTNRFLCMACKIENHLTLKHDHCQSEGHEANLKLSEVLQRFPGYFIRQIDNKHCHCAHCNKLHPIKSTNEHIRIEHEKKPVKTYVNNENMVAVTKIDSCQKQDVQKSTVQIQNGETERGSNWSVVIQPFDKHVCLSALNYNFLNKIMTGYFCCVCNVKLKSNFKDHCWEGSHIETLLRIPFIKEYGNNLIRMVKGSAHCGICNTFIKSDHIKYHIENPIHRTKRNTILENNDFTNSDYISFVATTENGNQGPEINKTPSGNINEVNTSSSQKFDIETPTTVVEVTVDTDSHKSVSSDSSDNDFDVEAFVLLKFKKFYVKVTLTSYNSLVPIGDAKRFCFVCNDFVFIRSMGKHVSKRTHAENLDSCKFLDKYGDDFIRQMYLTYHCGICNFIMTRSDVPKHIKYPLHKKLKSDLEKYKNCSNFSDKDLNIFTVATQKENIYLNAKENKIKMILNVKILKTNQNGPCDILD